MLTFKCLPHTCRPVFDIWENYFWKTGTNNILLCVFIYIYIFRRFLFIHFVLTWHNGKLFTLSSIDSTNASEAEQRANEWTKKLSEMKASRGKKTPPCNRPSAIYIFTRFSEKTSPGYFPLGFFFLSCMSPIKPERGGSSSPLPVWILWKPFFFLSFPFFSLLLLEDKTFYTSAEIDYLYL